jgi:sulfite reductase (NADPH) hemoprotein beta-component
MHAACWHRRGGVTMAVTDDPRTFGRARLTFANEAEVTEFAATLGRFERGEMSPDEWRSYRLLRGTYGQRQMDDAQMLRVKIPQGLLTAGQLAALADVADKYSRGFGHITTRQNMQFHFVKLHDVPLALGELAQAGLTTREACGNSVRNITACQFAGVSTTELFDVTPYSEALTRYFLRHPLSSCLPRKFKIGFEGCAEDHVKSGINDIGWRARVVDGRRGFRVNVGAGTAILCSPGHVLFEFLPVEEMLNGAECIVRVFHRFGDYKHKHKNRMKFLIRSMGWDKFREACLEAYEEFRREGGAALTFDPAHPPVEEAPGPSPLPKPAVTEIATRVLAAKLRGPGIHPETRPEFVNGNGAYAAWTETNVHPQKQAEYAVAVATVPLGDLTSAQMRVIADLSRVYSDGTVRVTPVQDLVFRWVPASELESFYHRLAAAGLGLAGADTVADVTSCPGAESCKLAVTQSRGLGRTLEQHLRDHPELARMAPTVDIKVSGCPNGCGQHHIAAIGFQGSLRKVGASPVPQYFLMLGGGITGESARFGRLMAKIPARRCTTAVERLIGLFAKERRADETAEDFFQRVEAATVKALLADLEVLTPETASPDDFIDLAETEQFNPETTEGECAV